MKKLLMSILVSVGLLVVLPMSAMAANPGSCTPVGDTACTYVAGTITSGGSPVTGASVTVVCNTNTLTATTTAGGGYIVEYPASQCASGSTANVSASKGGKSGSNSGTVNGETANINLAIVNVSLVPELGIITGISAAVIGSGAFLVIRRRQLSVH